MVLLLVCFRWRERIGRGFAAAGYWIVTIVKNPKTYKVAETFCNEVAVLWFVFPLVDQIYDPNRRGRPDSPSMAPAYLMAGLFFFFAIILSHAAKEEKEK